MKTKEEILKEEFLKFIPQEKGDKKMTSQEYDDKFNKDKRIFDVFLNAMEEYGNQQRQNDWTKGCNCENSIGQTWCCNQCGLPYDTRKSYKKYTEDDIRNAIQVGISAEAGDYPKGWSYKLGISLEDYFINSLNEKDLCK